MDKNKIFSKIIITSMLAGTVATLPSNVLAESVKLPKDLNSIASKGERDAVEYLFKLNKLSGYEDGTFRPGKQVTRAEFMAMLLDSLKYPDKQVNVEFKDVKKSDWHYDVLKNAYAHGLIKGSHIAPDGKVTMEPNAVIPREEMMLILVRAHELQFGDIQITKSEVEAILSKYKDKKQVPEWAKEDIAKAVKAKITSGVSADRLGIGEKGNRLQSAVFSYRMLKNAENGTPNLGEKPVIQLLGDKILNVFVGDTFNDPGVKIVDNEDGDVSSRVLVSGDKVNVNVPGVYAIHYNFTDSDGNAAAQETRMVVVKEDTVAPIVILNGPSVISIIEGQTYDELGVTAIDNREGDLSGNYVVQGIVDANTPGTYTLTYIVTDKAGNVGTVKRTVIVNEDPGEKPVIALKGDATITLYEGQSFIDPGVIVTDVEDGDVSSQVIIGGNEVKTDVAGTYVITYDYTDKDGNEATQVKRTVVVKADTVKPVITLNGDVTVIAYQGESYVDVGATANDNVDGDISENIVANTASVDTNRLGTYQVKYNVSDKAGNHAVEVVRTVIVKENLGAFNEDHLFIKHDKVLVEDATSMLAEKYQLPAENLSFVRPQPLEYGAVPTDYKVEDVGELVIRLDYGTKLNPKENYPHSAIYSLIVDNLTPEIRVDDKNKTITVKETDTLKNIKAAFETHAQSILGTNEVNIYAKQDGDLHVRGDMTFVAKDANNDVVYSYDDFIFGVNLNVSVGPDVLTVNGPNFDHILDLYKLNEGTGVWEKDVTKSDAFVRAGHKYSFRDLDFGNYKVVLQPPGLSGLEYTEEYEKRVDNETRHEIKPMLETNWNNNGELRLFSNIPSSKINPSNTYGTGDALEADILNEEKLIAELQDGVNGIYAEMIYPESQEDIIKTYITKVTMDIGVEAFDHDNYPNTPPVDFDTLKINLAGDYSQVAYGDSFDFDFKLSIKDKGNVNADAITEVVLKLKATVVQDLNRLVLKVEER